MLHLKGSCHCGAVEFECDSHAPVPFMRCYCSICRKTSGGGGYSVNIIAESSTLKVAKGQDCIKSYRAIKNKEAPKDKQEVCQNRYFCTSCASYLWAHDEKWDQWIYPYASAIDSELPAPEQTYNIMLDSSRKWALPDSQPASKADVKQFGGYPDCSLVEWHKAHGSYIE